MTNYLVYVPVFLIGYLLGSLNLAWFLAKRRGIDLGSHGSGNPGTANAVIVMGWKTGVLVGAHDIGKAVLAVWLCSKLFPAVPHCGVVAGVACVIGHMYPFYLRFRGGKGFASYLGMVLALNWRFALILVAAVIVLTLVTDYIVVGTMATVVSCPICCAVERDAVMALVLCVASAIIIYKHRINLVRIWKGTEIGLRATNRGDHRAEKK